LRIRPQATQVDGKYYTIPAGNFKEAFTSFYSEAELAKIKPEIYAMGMRNPYRVGVDSKTGWIFWGDVGPDAGSDNANRGRAGHDEFNLATKPGYFGWPYCNGNQFAYNAVDYSGTGSVIGAKYDCANLTNNSPHNTGVNKLPPAQAPLIWYAASNSTDHPAMGNGGAETAVAGPMYRYDANLVSTKKFPPQYDGRVYFWDWSRNQHKLLSFTADGKLDKTMNFPITGLKSHVSAQYGPEGALYMLQYSNAGYTGENITALIRIDYTGPHEPACFPTTKALRGSAPGSSKRLPVLAGFTAVDMPDGAAGFEAYDMQGKKVWTYIKAVGDPGRVNLPEHISGGLLRIRFL
jgi:cytochrome c